MKSISPGSGATFSLLPPDNATGNFTKITQRVPVRIEIAPSDETTQCCARAFSVIVTVDTPRRRAGGRRERRSGPCPGEADALTAPPYLSETNADASRAGSRRRFSGQPTGSRSEQTLTRTRL